jgi:hypothetical protein
MARAPQNQVAELQPEPRWPVALGIVFVALVMALLPGRIRLLPQWLNAVAAAAVLAPLIGVSIAPTNPACRRAERFVTLAFVAFAAAGSLASLHQLLLEVIGRHGPVGGLALLSSSVSLWGLNVLNFSLLYWQMDRGGPLARIGGKPARRPDWTFPQSQMSEDEVPPGWRPTYPDYLFLSFSTATAFSTTDVAPLTVRAKMAMMLESLISLMTLALVASRAINILGS